MITHSLHYHSASYISVRTTIDVSTRKCTNAKGAATFEFTAPSNKNDCVRLQNLGSVGKVNTFKLTGKYRWRRKSCATRAVAQSRSKKCKYEGRWREEMKIESTRRRIKMRDNGAERDRARTCTWSRYFKQHEEYVSEKPARVAGRRRTSEGKLVWESHQGHSAILHDAVTLVPHCLLA